MQTVEIASRTILRDRYSLLLVGFLCSVRSCSFVSMFVEGVGMTSFDAINMKRDRARSRMSFTLSGKQGASDVHANRIESKRMMNVSLLVDAHGSGFHDACGARTVGFHFIPRETVFGLASAHRHRPKTRSARGAISHMAYDPLFACVPAMQQGDNHEITAQFYDRKLWWAERCRLPTE